MKSRMYNICKCWLTFCLNDVTKEFFVIFYKLPFSYNVFDTEIVFRIKILLSKYLKKSFWNKENCSSVYQATVSTSTKFILRNILKTLKWNKYCITLIKFTACVSVNFLWINLQITNLLPMILSWGAGGY